MTDVLDKLIDTAKKLRKAVKKIDNAQVADLIVDLNLHLADLKVQLAESRHERPHHHHDGHDEDEGAEHAATSHGNAVSAPPAHGSDLADSRWSPARP